MIKKKHSKQITVHKWCETAPKECDGSCCKAKKTKGGRK